MGYMSVLGTCARCDVSFYFTPDRVVSMRVRKNGVPLDLHDDGTPGRSYTQEEYDNARQLVFCPNCVRDDINPKRREQGSSEWPVFDSEPYQEV